jgi:hypothetical protein
VCLLVERGAAATGSSGCQGEDRRRTEGRRFHSMRSEAPTLRCSGLVWSVVGERRGCVCVCVCVCVCLYRPVSIGPVGRNWWCKGVADWRGQLEPTRLGAGLAEELTARHQRGAASSRSTSYCSQDRQTDRQTDRYTHTTAKSDTSKQLNSNTSRSRLTTAALCELIDEPRLSCCSSNTVLPVTARSC